MLQTMTDFVKRRFEKHFEFNLCFQNWRKNVGWVIMKDFGHKKIHFPFFKIEFVEGIERWGSMRCLMKSDRVPSHRKQPLRGKFWDWTKNFGFFYILIQNQKMTSSLLKIVHIDKFENQPYMILKDVFIHHNKNIMFCNRQPSKSIYIHIWGKKLLRGGKKLFTSSTFPSMWNLRKEKKVIVWIWRFLFL